MVWGTCYPIKWHLGILSTLELKENGTGKIYSLNTSFFPGIGQKTLGWSVLPIFRGKEHLYLWRQRKTYRNLKNKNKNKTLCWVSPSLLRLACTYHIFFPTTFYSSANLVLKTLRFDHFFRSLFPYEDKYMLMHFSCSTTFHHSHLQRLSQKTKMGKGDPSSPTLRYSKKIIRAVASDRFYFCPGSST